MCMCILSKQQVNETAAILQYCFFAWASYRTASWTEKNIKMLKCKTDDELEIFKKLVN